MVIQTRPESAFLDAPRFMYTDTVTLKKENMADMWECARFYDIPSLATVITEWALHSSQSNPEDVLLMYAKAAELGMDRLCVGLTPLIAEFASCSSELRHGLRQLPLPLVLPILEHPRLRFKSEWMRYIFLRKYVRLHREPPLSDDAIANLFSRVLFTLLPIAELKQAYIDNLAPKFLITRALFRRLDCREGVLKITAKELTVANQKARADALRKVPLTRSMVTLQGALTASDSDLTDEEDLIDGCATKAAFHVRNDAAPGATATFTFPTPYCITATRLKSKVFYGGVTWAIEWSDDGDTWEQVATLSMPETCKFDTPRGTNHKMWRYRLLEIGDLQRVGDYNVKVEWLTLDMPQSELAGQELWDLLL